MTSLQASLDDVLNQLGDFGKYQIFVFSLISFSVILSSCVSVAFVFTAKDLEYRCRTECDEELPEFRPDWLINAVPFNRGEPKNCEKYQFISNTSYNNNAFCRSDQFNKDVLESCDQFVYKTERKSILIDFNLHCDNNLWMLTLVGTVNVIGQFIGLPLSGILSDKYGRRTLLILGLVLSGIFGIARSFSPNYITFCIFEFLDAISWSGTYVCGFVLAVELVGPKKRVLAGSIYSACYAIGEVLIGAAAWLVYSWRFLLLIIYSPLLLIISYIWTTPESVRWLLTQGRQEEAKQILLKVAQVNNKTVSKDTLDKLEEPTEEDVQEPFMNVFKSKILVARFVNTSIIWIACAFLFYGLTLNSVALAGNSYLDFILTALIEIPAYVLTYFMVDKFGRTWSQSGLFFITAISCSVFILIDDEQETLLLCFYLIGKFGATGAFTVMYILASEIFPTPLRPSLMNTCSMFGRIGSIVAPQIPLLSALWTPLPLVMCAAMAAIAGFLTLFFPETLNTKLPDTIEEAENIGRRKEKIQLD